MKKNRSLEYCAWAGQLAMFMMFMAMWPAWHILPPPDPALPLADMANHFRQHPMGMIMGGVIMLAAGSVFFLFWGGAVACFKKMEGASTPLTYTVMMLIPFGFFPFYLMAVLMTDIGFRPDLSDESIRLLADETLFLLVLPGAAGLVQFVVTGFIILNDVNPQPIFPRWVAYLNIWVGILSVPGAVVGFFKAGPFAWNGILAFWVPAVVFGVLINVMFWAMRRAASHPAMQRS